MTALVVISVLYVGGPLSVDATGMVDGIDKTNMAQLAFGTFFGSTFGNSFVAICLLMFAFSTILSWNLFAKLNVEYLFARFGKMPVKIFSVIALIFIFLGSLLSNDLVWELADMFNQLMVHSQRHRTVCAVGRGRGRRQAASSWREGRARRIGSVSREPVLLAYERARDPRRRVSLFAVS